MKSHPLALKRRIPSEPPKRWPVEEDPMDLTTVRRQPWYTYLQASAEKNRERYSAYAKVAMLAKQPILAGDCARAAARWAFELRPDLKREDDSTITMEAIIIEESGFELL